MSIMSNSNSSDVVLRRALGAYGHRFTEQRSAVFRHVSDTTDHPTAEEILRSVRSEIPRISLATVYKSLETLVTCGLAKKLNHADGSARYCCRSDPHHHARCLSCGGVSDVPGRLDESQVARIRAKANGFRLLEYELELTGYCPECASDMDSEAPLSSC